MYIRENVNIKPLLTFDVDSYVREYISIDKEEDVMQAIGKAQYQIYILGGGSNLIPPPKWDVTLLKNNIQGISVMRETSDEVLIRVGGGVNWHEFVQYTLKHDYFGLENLSLIPGTVGASPVQNIGAYGVELKDYFYHLEGIDLRDGSQKLMVKEQCEFAYRDSIFKHKLKNNFFITYVTFKLSRNPQINIGYGAIKDRLIVGKFKNPTPQDISKVIIDIRKEKLPDPESIPNCGSFFKNPIVNRSKIESLRKDYETIPFYEIDHEHVKIPAAWLIDTAGLKGKSKNDIGCYEKQPLVLVNHGDGTYHALIEWAEHVVNTVKNKFGVSLEREVNVIPS